MKVIDNDYEDADNFRKLLLKSNLEFRLAEYFLSRETLLESFAYLNMDESNLKSLFALTAICSEWDRLFQVIRANESAFLNGDFKEDFTKSVQKIYLKKYQNVDLEISEILHSCKNKVESSIMRYLLSTIEENVDLKVKYCEEALELWNENLASADYLNMKDDIKNISRLIELDKFDFKLNKIKKADDYGFEFMPLGGGNEVGANCYFIKINNLQIIVDAGIKINGSMTEYPDFDFLIKNQLIDKIDFVIITHAHLDHCGSVLELYKLNKNLKFLMTEETMELMKINLKAKGLNYDDIYLLEELMKKVKALKFNHKLISDDKKSSIELYKAGHILGAASVFIETENCNVYMTGDFCLKNQKVIEGAALPKDAQVDILITESTYRNKEIVNQNINGALAFGRYVIDALNEGRKVLIPAFAIGRTQEIIAIINDSKRESDKKFRLYIDGSSIKATQTYEQITGRKIAGANSHYANDTFYSSKEDFIREEVMNNESCVVSSSGMLLNDSASSRYAKIMLQDENSVCILTGYQAYNTPGDNLQKQIDEKKRYITIGNDFINIKSEIKSFNLTAHATINDILAVEGLLKAGNVILVHGSYKDDETILEKKLKRFNDINVIQSINNEKIKL